MPPILLLTRPLAQSRRFALAARDLPPHEVLIAPLSEVVALPFDPAVFAGAKGLILTSANAVPMLPSMPGMPAWCVGPATARAAEAAGFAVREGGGDAAALIEALRKAAPPGPLIHAHGTDLARDLAKALPDLVRGVAVYAAVEQPLGDAARLALRARRVFAPLFSPRAARLFGADLPEAAALTCVAISPACAAALPVGLAITVADRPDSGGMLRALAGVMSQHSPAG